MLQVSWLWSLPSQLPK